MNDQKNKQQQPQQGNKQDKDMNQQGQKSGSNSDLDRKRAQSNIENPDQPDKKTNIDDNPGETKKKIPNM